jgi:hypothetical protein
MAVVTARALPEHAAGAADDVTDAVRGPVELLRHRAETTCHDLSAPSLSRLDDEATVAERSG